MSFYREELVEIITIRWRCVDMPGKVSDPFLLSEKLLSLLAGSIRLQAIYTITKLKIPDMLAFGPRSCEELAKMADTQVPLLYRTMRFLCTEDIFIEHEDQCFGLGQVGQLLRSDTSDSWYAQTLMFGEPWLTLPLRHFSQTLAMGISTIQAEYGTDLFAYLSKHPESEQIFQQSMSAYSRSGIPSIMSAYDFSQFRTIVDVGGGHGTLMEQLLLAAPGVRGIVFDQPAIIQGTIELMKNSGLEERCECVGGSFFETVPAGGDAYVMKHIIHDWSDDEAVTILSHCREAMGDNGKLLLLEIVVDSENDRKFGKILDIEMLMISSGKERTKAEYEQLLLDAGFRLQNIIPTSTHMSIIEGLPIV